MKQYFLLVLLLGFFVNAWSYTDTTKQAKKKEKKFTYNIIPLPSYDPSTKFGLNIANMFTFKMNAEDQVSPRSMVGIGFQGTTNGTLMMGGGGTLYIDEDKWRINPQFVFGRVHQELELGFPSTTDARRKILVINMQVLRLVYNRIYLGLGYSYRGISYEGRDEESSNELDLVGLSGGEGNHGLKYFVTQDKRDNVNYPYQGYYVSLRAEQYFTGERATPYNAFYIDYRHFFNLGEVQGKQMLTYRFLTRFLGGSPQEQNYSYYGRTGGDIERGYETGTHIDKNMFNFELEYRHKTSWLKDRFGFVGFAGLGKVFGDYEKFSNAEFLPMIGAGLRYEVQEAARMNVRFDASVGKEGFMFYFGIMEAF